MLWFCEIFFKEIIGAGAADRRENRWRWAFAGDCARRLMSLAAERDAFVIFGHCPEQWPTLRKIPEYYA